MHCHSLPSSSSGVPCRYFFGQRGEYQRKSVHSMPGGHPQPVTGFGECECLQVSVRVIEIELVAQICAPAACRPPVLRTWTQYSILILKCTKRFPSRSVLLTFELGGQLLTHSTIFRRFLSQALPGRAVGCHARCDGI